MKNSVADPDSGSVIQIRDGGEIRIRIRDAHPIIFSESLETVFRVKILKLFDADPGSGIFLTLYPGSGIYFPDPQH
jgi:hypothetical protein